MPGFLKAQHVVIAAGIQTPNPLSRRHETSVPILSGLEQQPTPPSRTRYYPATHHRLNGVETNSRNASPANLALTLRTDDHVLGISLNPSLSAAAKTVSAYVAGS